MALQKKDVFLVVGLAALAMLVLAFAGPHHFAEGVIPWASGK